jgi:hypothetical protein
MKAFTIGADNNITVHASAKVAPKTEGTEFFTNENALAELAAAWPAARLVDIFSSLAGVTPVKKFADRKKAVARIWAAIQNLGQTEKEAGETARPEAVISESTECAPAATVAPQASDVASPGRATRKKATSPEPPAETAAINVENCAQLLRVAAQTQGPYWDALRELEEAIGFEIDDPGDLDEATVESLIERHQARRSRSTGTRGMRENSKASQVIAMLRREGGTTLEEIMTAMGWQKHTTRAVLSAGGSLTKKHGLVVTSEKAGEKRVYSIKS